MARAALSDSGDGVSLLAGVIYRALAWRECRRARRELQPAAGRRAAAAGKLAPHLESGRRGENLAYWHLRRSGYVVIARNRRRYCGCGELDLVAWDGPVLAFVEVKTRSSLAAGPPELAVSHEQRKRIIRAAKVFIRGLGREVSYRFDIVSVLWHAGPGFELRLIKDAFKS